MTTVDFYVLDGTNGLKSLHYACQLVEKAHYAQKQVYIHTQTIQEAERMDLLLWTFRDDSFLPHQIYDPTDTMAVTIQIGHSAMQPPENTSEVLFNLSPEVPSFYKRFQHITEIVFSDPIVQQLARDRFKFYRDQGCILNTYKIKANDL